MRIRRTGKKTVSMATIRRNIVLKESHHSNTGLEAEGDVKKSFKKRGIARKLFESPETKCYVVLTANNSQVRQICYDSWHQLQIDFSKKKWTI